MSNRLLGLGGLGLLALLTGWFLFSLESSLREPQQPASDLPVLVMQDFQATRMNEQGVRQYTLAAPRMVQLPGDQGTWLEQPAIDVYQDASTREWLIRAERGWVAADNSLIRLESHVTLERPAASGKTPLVITTRNLQVYPEQRLVQTEEAARLDAPGGKLEAVGVRAYLDEDRLELLSAVRGIYEPPPKP